MADDFDVVVAGGGIGGLTAAVHSARMGRATLALAGRAPGGFAGVVRPCAALGQEPFATHLKAAPDDEIQTFQPQDISVRWSVARPAGPTS